MTLITAHVRLQKGRLLKRLHGLAAPIIAGGLVLSPLVAIAEPSSSDWSLVTSLSGGWVDANLRVVLSGPFHNPSGCAFADGYIVDASLPGAQLLQAMLMTAYASGDQVRVIVDGCVLSRPRVIGLDIRKP